MTENKGDLISREALKEALKSGCERCSDANTNWCEHCCKINDFEDLIDDAPTVEQEVYITGEDYNLYMRGYNQARKDFERPQGEWIRKQVSPAGCIYVCSQCGMEEVIGGNFCWNCGAYMKGKEE